MNENKVPFEGIEEELPGAIRHWWVFLILGILAIVMGVWLFFTPVGGFAALSIVFAVTFLIAGLSSCAVTLLNRQAIPAWGWNLISGLLMLILGIIMTVHLNITADILVFYVAFAIMFGGLNTVGFSFTAKSRGDKGWGWTLALGVLVVILAITLMLHPVFTALTIVIWAGIAFLSLGIAFCNLAYRLSKTNGRGKDK